MKKFVVASILSCLVVEIATILIYVFLSGEECDEKIVTISTIFVQGVLSGIITFIGLFFTILSQEHMTEKKRSLDRCPCFIINQDSEVSTEENLDSIEGKNEILICSKSEIVREVTCIIINVKDNYGINVTINGNKSHKFIGNINQIGVRQKFVFSGEGDDEFNIMFEDVYGTKYCQHIKCFYSEDNKYQFISYQPVRR